ncbi:MAG TPA: hypothetical protein VGC32_18250 [Solirubrobacterales bacterium]
MSEQKGRGSNFEERLLVRLKAVVAERGAAATEDGAGAPLAASPGPRRSRRPLRLALAGAAALAVAVIVLIVSSGGSDTSKAFAVEPQSGGGVAIQIYSLEEAAQLEAALERAGIAAQVDWLPAQTTCAARKLTPSMVRTSMGAKIGGFEVGGGGGAGLTIGVMTKAQYRAVSRADNQRALAGDGGQPTVPNISFDPRSFRPGQSIIVVGSPEPRGGDPEGGYRARLEVVEGPVPPCKQVPEAAGTIGAIAASPGGSEAAAAAAAALPKPGQFLFTKTEAVQLEGWEPGGRGAGPKDHPRHFTANLLGPEGNAMAALVPRIKEIWTGTDGRTRVRETLGQIEFLAAADQRRWEAAGSPPPFDFDPAENPIHQDGAGRPYKEFSRRSFRGDHVFSAVPKLFSLPTEAQPLRLAIEHRSAGGRPAGVSSREGRATVDRLVEILTEPITSPELRAAAFGALGEVPGVRPEAGVADATGRRGEALTWNIERGFGHRVIFDPRTSKVLAEAQMILGPPSTHDYDAPPKTAFSETVYLDSAIVDSAQERTSAR